MAEILIGVDWAYGPDKTVVVLWDGDKIVDIMTWEDWNDAQA